VGDCAFCSIAQARIPARRVYEDKMFLAFLDIAPSNPGHILVIPKEHHETLLDLPDAISARILGVVKKIAAAATQATGAQGFNVLINNQSAAGQVVFHSHFHIIPRFKGDGLKHWAKKEIPGQEMDAICRKIVSFV